MTAVRTESLTSLFGTFKSRKANSLERIHISFNLRIKATRVLLKKKNVVNPPFNSSPEIFF